jgi:hypothetical protein
MSKAVKQIAIVVGCLLALMFAGRAGHRTLVVTDLANIHADELTHYDTLYRRWWDSTAACLGTTKRMAARARWFATDTIPAAMVDLADRRGEVRVRGYTDPSAQVVVLAREDSLARDIVTHEAWHLVFGTGHPDRYFKPPRCGMAAP